MGHIIRSIVRLAAVLVLSATALVGVMVTPAAAAPVGFATTLVGDVSCQLATVDLASGALAPFGPASSDHCARDLAFAPDGTLYGIVLGPTATEPDPTFSFMRLVRFDTNTGAATLLGQVTTFDFTFSTAAGLAFDATGTLYAQFASADPSCSATGVFCLYRVDPSNPSAATLVGPASEGENALHGLAGECEGTLFTEQVLPQDQIQASLLSEDPANAQVTIIGSIGPEDTMLFGYDFDTLGVLWGLGQTSAAGQLRVFTVDPSTGAATAGVNVTGAPQGALSGLAIAPLTCATGPAPVPAGPTFTG
jgi:hypothetical protein